MKKRSKPRGPAPLPTTPEGWRRFARYHSKRHAKAAAAQHQIDLKCSADLDDLRIALSRAFPPYGGIYARRFL